MKTDTTILASAMYALAMDIQSDDGIANAAIREAGARLIEQYERISELHNLIYEIKQWDISTKGNGKIQISIFKIPYNIRNKMQQALDHKPISAN